MEPRKQKLDQHNPVFRLGKQSREGGACAHEKEERGKATKSIRIIYDWVLFQNSQ